MTLTKTIAKQQWTLGQKSFTSSHLPGRKQPTMSTPNRSNFNKKRKSSRTYFRKILLTKINLKKEEELFGNEEMKPLKIEHLNLD